MTQKDEALKMAIAWIEADWKPTNKEAVIQACKEALAQTAQEPVAKIRVDFIKNQLNNLPKNTKLVEVLEDGTLKQL